jgi:hypothetical protein
VSVVSAAAWLKEELLCAQLMKCAHQLHAAVLTISLACQEEIMIATNLHICFEYSLIQPGL